MSKATLEEDINSLKMAGTGVCAHLCVCACMSGKGVSPSAVVKNDHMGVGDRKELGI